MGVYLDPGAGVKHDVLDGPLDVLGPGHQPRDLVVMANLLPLGPRGRLGVLGIPTGSRQGHGGNIKILTHHDLAYINLSLNPSLN